jgi:hypothetical protein
LAEVLAEAFFFGAGWRLLFELVGLALRFIGLGSLFLPCGLPDLRTLDGHHGQVHRYQPRFWKKR